MLESARKPQMSARDILAAGVNKLLGPLRSGKKQQAGGDWAGQLGTPRSWGASSGGLGGLPAAMGAGGGRASNAFGWGSACQLSNGGKGCGHRWDC